MLNCFIFLCVVEVYAVLVQPMLCYCGICCTGSGYPVLFQYIMYWFSLYHAGLVYTVLV